LFRETEFVDISNLLGEGFFADRVVSLLQRSGSLDSIDKQVLIRVKSFFQKILDGQEQVRSARLSSDTIESIDAYQRAIIAFNKALKQKSEDTMKAKFKDLITAMTSEVDSTLENQRVIPEKVKTTLEFFRYIRLETLKESNEYFSSRVVLKWPKRPVFQQV